MRVVSVSYNPKYDQPDPKSWLQRLDFYMCILESLSVHCEVISIDMIAWEGELQQKGVKHIFLSNNYSLFHVNRFVKRLQPDIVLVQGFLFPAAVIHLGLIKSSKTKIILQHHAERPFAHIKAALFKIASRYIDAYFFATRSVAAEWIQKKMIPADKMIMAIPEASSVFVPRLPLPKEPLSCLWVGRMNVNKDPITVARAFIEYAGTHHSAKLYMIFPPGELLDEVAGIVRENDTKGNIELIGEIDRKAMQLWYERSACIICSSYYEGCNISVIEGMSCGCIPIVTAIPSFDLHTDHGRIGFQFEPGNVPVLVRCLSQVSAINMTEESNKALEYYHEALSPDAIGKKVYSVMLDLAG